MKGEKKKIIIIKSEIFNKCMLDMPYHGEEIYVCIYVHLYVCIKHEVTFMQIWIYHSVPW